MSEDTTSESKDKASKLDLGLSSFLNGGGDEIKAASQDVGSLSEILKKSVELTQIPPQIEGSKPEVESEFQSLAKSSKWQELSRLCEEKLAASRDADKSAKLWWIKSQYETKAIPVSILAPGLNLISKDILSSTDISQSEKSICRSLLSVFSKNLISNNDYELALVFIGHIFSESAGGPEALSMLAELEKTVEVNSTFQNNDLVKADIIALKEKYKLTTALPLEEKITTVKTSTSMPETPRKSKFKYVLALLILLTLLPAAYFLLPAASLSRDFTPSLATRLDYAEQVLIEPQPDRVAGLNHLDALYYEVSAKDNNPPNNDSLNSLPPAAEIPVKYAPPTVRIPNRSPEELENVGANTKSSTKEKVNTTYPLERSHELDNTRDQEIEEKIPEIDFPPFRSNRPKPVNEKNAPNYVVIARTRVMTEPSYWAYAGADLKEGDKVKVEEVQGKWLKIKAKNGDIGYILAQDAVKIY